MATYILTSMFPNGFNQEVAEQLQKTITQRGNFAFVASEFNKLHEKTDKYFALFLNMFSEINIVFENAYVVDGRMEKEEAQKAVSKADVVWLSGGDTPVQYGYLQEYGLDTILKEHQGVIIGMSAGSINMAELAICTLSCGHAKQQIYQGIGCVDISVEPHFIPEKVSEELLELSQKYVIYGLCDDAIIVVKKKEVTFCGDVYELWEGKLQKVSDITKKCC